MNRTDFSVGLVVLGDQVSYSQIVSMLLEGGGFDVRIAVGGEVDATEKKTRA